MSTAYNAQFFQLDFRLLGNPDFLELMRSPAFAAYMLLVRYIWRGRDRRPSTSATTSANHSLSLTRRVRRGGGEATWTISPVRPAISRASSQTSRVPR